MSSLKYHQCTNCHRLVPVWVKPDDPYVCPLCKSDRLIQSYGSGGRGTGSSAGVNYWGKVGRTTWGIVAAKRLAEELSVELETDPTGLRVRESGRDGDYVPWVTMYGRLYQRKRMRDKKRGT